MYGYFVILAIVFLVHASQSAKLFYYCINMQGLLKNNKTRDRRWFNLCFSGVRTPAYLRFWDRFIRTCIVLWGRQYWVVGVCEDSAKGFNWFCQINLCGLSPVHLNIGNFPRTTLLAEASMGEKLPPWSVSPENHPSNHWPHLSWQTYQTHAMARGGLSLAYPLCGSLVEE